MNKWALKNHSKTMKFCGMEGEGGKASLNTIRESPSAYKPGQVHSPPYFYERVDARMFPLTKPSFVKG